MNIGGTVHRAGQCCGGVPHRKGDSRHTIVKTALLCTLMGTVLFPGFLHAAEFGLAENILGLYGAIRYENTYTRVPTSGKIVAIKITDSGTTYYICREKSGYVIYHLEIRPMKGHKKKVEQVLKEESRKWNASHPNELFLTKGRFDEELEKLKKYREAVWIRNEVLVDGSAKNLNDH